MDCHSPLTKQCWSMNLGMGKPRIEPGAAGLEMLHLWFDSYIKFFHKREICWPWATLLTLAANKTWLSLSLSRNLIFFLSSPNDGFSGVCTSKLRPLLRRRFISMYFNFCCFARSSRRRRRRWRWRRWRRRRQRWRRWRPAVFCTWSLQSFLSGWESRQGFVPCLWFCFIGKIKRVCKRMREREVSLCEVRETERCVRVILQQREWVRDVRVQMLTPKRYKRLNSALPKIKILRRSE